MEYLKEKESREFLERVKLERYKCISLIMLDCGLRVSETISLKFENIDWKKKEILVNTLKRKDDTIRVVPMNKELYNTLVGYVHSKNIRDGYLFPSSSSKTGHVTRQAVHKYVKKVGGIYPHMLRHTCATNMLNNGANVIEVKDMLGHSSYMSTQVYLHSDREEIREKLKRNDSRKIIGLFTRLVDRTTQWRNDIVINSRVKKIFYGRREDLKICDDYIDRGINVVVIGKVGVGKSMFIDEVCRERKRLVIDDMKDLKNTMISILLSLYDGDKKKVAELQFPDLSKDSLKTRVTRFTTINLAREIVNITSQGEYVLQIDNIDDIGKTAVRVLEEFKDHFVIVTSARFVKNDKMSFLWNFEKMDLKNMNRKDSMNVISRLARDFEFECKDFTRNHIYEQSDGNPRAMFEMCDRLSKERFLNIDNVRGIKHGGARSEIDMTFMLFIGLGGLAVLRYLSMENGESSFKFIGGAAMILMFVARSLMSWGKKLKL